MPFGVPKVPFEFEDPDADEEDGEVEVTWMDLYNLLFRERVLFLGRAIKPEITNHLVSLMVFLTVERDDWSPMLLINSPGGYIFNGLSLYDTVRLSGARTLCVGTAVSMASVILVGGSDNKRAAFPHARVMIHQPRINKFEDEGPEVIMEARIMLDLRHHIVEIYVLKTGQPFWVISVDLEVDTYLTPTEAKIYGLVDLILIKAKDAEE
uniref:ATP-dependent Clp protease proteolytic subunit n=1 Tax=Erodium texanum TaxID=28960 RepID=E2FET6_EROTE|nr:clp protease proteolytic subunit [Erodium texanum]YP_003933908.1 clp protease proteolytic subunit [Erodium texanum]ADJ66291.1 clp protease proteolytic subunit [Erodium texanum]ADJ66307.1 clp protease proteolytic subunit [Erodium texanum]